MVTRKKRINLVVGDEVLGHLEELAGKQGKSLASTSLALIEQALELLEDKHLSAEADERLTRKQKRVSHAKAWRE
jgi:predicted DNA-binding protein